MNLDPSFNREIVVDIDAAVVGVSRDRWTVLGEDEATTKRASEIMRTERFDILPIVAENGQVKEYFYTRRWNNFDKILRSTIRHSDVIPSQTTIRDVISGFAQDDRLFYFLSHEHRIAGLITIVHLNSRQIQIYLFSLLCELEVRLAALISTKAKEVQILPYLRERARKRFEQDKRSALEVSAIEYAYFPSLFDLLNDLHLFGELGFASGHDTSEINALRTVRNKVAHPVSSVITSTDAVEALWAQIDLIEDLLFRLRMVQHDDI